MQNLDYFENCDLLLCMCLLEKEVNVLIVMIVSNCRNWSKICLWTWKKCI